MPKGSICQAFGPVLRTILVDAFEQAATADSFVAPLASRFGINLRTHLERIVERAGHKPWPRSIQNLRASCATDRVERYPAHRVAK